MPLELCEVNINIKGKIYFFGYELKDDSKTLDYYQVGAYSLLEFVAGNMVEDIGISVI